MHVTLSRCLRHGPCSVSVGCSFFLIPAADVAEWYRPGAEGPVVKARLCPSSSCCGTWAMEPPWLLYRRMTKPISGRAEIVYAEHYLYNAWHMWILKKWSKWGWEEKRFSRRKGQQEQ